jgi:hypothetical protein
LAQFIPRLFRKAENQIVLPPRIGLAKERILECLVPLARDIQNLSKFRLAVQIV